MISNLVQWSFYFKVDADPISSYLVGIVLFISVQTLGMWRVHRMDLVERSRIFKLMPWILK